MERPILVGTIGGLWHFGPTARLAEEALTGRTVTALVRDGARTWAITDGRTLCATQDSEEWQVLASIEGPPATCLAPTSAGLFVGMEGAHLLRMVDGHLEPVVSFESVEGRESWYTPWGDPPDVRSIAVDQTVADGAIYVNVHVGGVVYSRDGGRSWAPTLDIENDVHQVLLDPRRPGVVLVAAAVGLGVSHDGDDSWRFVTAGLHGRYLRAVAVSEEAVLVTASTGPRGKRAAVYRKPLDGAAKFERCRRGLPEWFDGNIDTACLGAAGSVAAFGTEDGRVFRSLDGGTSWELFAKGLPAIRCVIVG
jgi:hypothetical protein